MEKIRYGDHKENKHLPADAVGPWNSFRLFHLPTFAVTIIRCANYVQSERFFQHEVIKSLGNNLDNPLISDYFSSISNGVCASIIKVFVLFYA